MSDSDKAMTDRGFENKKAFKLALTFTPVIPSREVYLRRFRDHYDFFCREMSTENVTESPDKKHTS